MSQEDSFEGQDISSQLEITRTKQGNYFINGELFVPQILRYFVRLNGAMYELNEIFNYSSIDEVRTNENLQEIALYSIKLNENPDENKQKTRHADKKIIYATREQRDADFNKLDRTFCDRDNIIVV